MGMMQVPDFGPTFFKGAEATDDQRKNCKDATIKFLDTLEKRFADGRKYCSGAQIAAGDFQLLALDAGIFSNTESKNPAFNKELGEELAKRTNVKRIIDQVRGENGLDDYIKTFKNSPI